MKTKNKQNLLVVALAVALVAIALSSATPPVQAQQKKPNILFILVDNLGYGEIGSYGGGLTRGAPTPRIDRFLSSSTSTPTREENPTADSWVVTPMLKMVAAFNATTKDHPLIQMGTPDPYTPPARDARREHTRGERRKTIGRRSGMNNPPTALVGFRMRWNSTFHYSPTLFSSLSALRSLLLRVTHRAACVF